MKMQHPHHAGFHIFARAALHALARTAIGAALVLSAAGAARAQSTSLHTSLHASFHVTAGDFIINQATLAVSLKPREGPVLPLAAAALAGASVQDRSDRRWQIVSGPDRFTVTADIDDDALRLSIRSDGPATLNWPQTAEPQAISGYAFPFGEGSYVPANDAAWLDWLVRRYEPENLAGILSMPFWTELRKDRSITWIVETPLDTTFGIRRAANRPQPGLIHDFSRLAPGAAYTVRIAAGPNDPLAGARSYRRWLKASGNFTALTDKIKALPNTAKLGGAAHIYLWGAGPLKARDVLQWRPFVRQFELQKDDPAALAGQLWQAFDEEARASFSAAFKEAAEGDGFVAAWRQTELVRAINAALLKAVPRVAAEPLPGGHDPAAEVMWARTMRAKLLTAFGPLLAPAQQWGGGLSVDTVAALQRAGLAHAWLGAEDWRDALWHPEAVAAAKAAGYLVGVYDSYNSAHPSELAETWPTAQMGDELAAAGYREKTGKPKAGFNGKGVDANAWLRRMRSGASAPWPKPPDSIAIFWILMAPGPNPKTTLPAAKPARLKIRQRASAGWPTRRAL